LVATTGSSSMRNLRNAVMANSYFFGLVSEAFCFDLLLSSYIASTVPRRLLSNNILIFQLLRSVLQSQRRGRGEAKVYFSYIVRP
jgi:hypothetical protein